MDRAAIVRYATGAIPLAVLSVLLLGALFLMSVATESSTLLGPLYSVFLVISILGILFLLAMILASIYTLAVQFRARVVGSRLTLRLLGIFTVLAVAPVAVVLIFSLQVVNRGIDSWFDVKTEKALDDALAVGRAALDASKKELLKNTRAIAIELEDNPGKLAVPALDFLRDKYAISELTLLSQEGRIVASSSEAGPGATKLVPDRPSDTILVQVRQGQDYANLDAIRRGDLQLRVVVAVTPREVGAPLRILQALQPLPARYAELSQSVQTAFAEYQKLVYLRGPLKFGFTLTLGLVALLTVLIAASAAIFSARRLSAPIRDLAAGTRAVARGDYGKQLPVQGRDEFGILVESFNDMTRKIREAQNQIKRSRAEAEMQHTYLQTVLTHLSSGVLSFNGRNCLRTHNAAAAQILRTDLEPLKGKSLASIARAHPELSAFCEAVRHAMEQGRDEWQTEATLPGKAGRRALIVRGTMLPGTRQRKSGYVLVFDDVTALIQAERDAAWREVARRLAHEIKNPLTPIQLSAERIRHKCMPALADNEQRTLERSTHTIIEQVEALKSMVNAFTDYARPVYMQPGSMDLNVLIRDVVELYGATVEDIGTGAIAAPGPSRATRRRRAKGSAPLTIQLDLQPHLRAIYADGGRLRQVLHNLLLNAREALASNEAPIIRIHTREVVNDHGASVHLSVEDNGPGIPDKLMDNLFEPYVTTREKGTGLGLAIVKKIIEEHNGTLAAENLPGTGARISITLPLAESATADGDARGRVHIVASREKRA